MIEDRLIAPALHELGFKENGSRWLWYRRGDYETTFSTQKSRYSTWEEVGFWVHLTAAHAPTRSVYWRDTLAAFQAAAEQDEDHQVRCRQVHAQARRPSHAVQDSTQ